MEFAPGGHTGGGAEIERIPTSGLDCLTAGSDSEKVVLFCDEPSRVTIPSE